MKRLLGLLLVMGMVGCGPSEEEIVARYLAERGMV